MDALQVASLELGVVGKIPALKFIKPEVQGTSLCTWGVVRRELCSEYWNKGWFATDPINVFRDCMR